MTISAVLAQTPEVPREFRGVWVATVNNIDWPSRRDLTTAQQKAELVGILNRAVELNLNVIVLQVRPGCDAIYDSKIEPWSEFLTGQMGRAPRPYYDPLAFAVEEAHKRGLELHAWFNPYRVRSRDDKTPVCAGHVSHTHPELVRAYGSYWWLDPTEAGTRAYSLSVIMDVVRRYDIDGVQFDDYFYPYPQPEGKRELDFPDSASWARYLAIGGHLSRNDWRRENVNMFVQSVYEAIKAEKPWVKFGISPFGIWRPNHPPGITGFDAYDGLFGDSQKWLANGWVDYFAPQVYWPIADKPHSFTALLKWWTEQNPKHRLLLAGMRDSNWREIKNEAAETTGEIYAARKQIGVSGEILYDSAALVANRNGVAEALRNGPYREPALVPACSWLAKDLPARPIVTARESNGEIKLRWKEETGEAWRWVVRKLSRGRWTTEIFPAGVNNQNIAAGPRHIMPDLITVAAVNRYGNMSEAVIVNTPVSP